jgi:hypothetical protein
MTDNRCAREAKIRFVVEERGSRSCFSAAISAPFLKSNTPVTTDGFVRATGEIFATGQKTQRIGGLGIGRPTGFWKPGWGDKAGGIPIGGRFGTGCPDST